MTDTPAVPLHLSAPVHDWDGGGLGTWRTDQPSWVATARIIGAPSLTGDPILAARSTLSAARRLAVTATASAGLLATQLRISNHPSTGALEVLLRCRAEGSPQVANSCLETLLNALPDQLTLQRGATPSPLPRLADPAVLELLRGIDVEPPAHPDAARHYRVADIRTPRALSGDASGWHSVHDAIARSTAPVQLSVVVKSTRLTHDELALADAYASALTSLGRDHQTTDLLGYPRTIKADASAAAAAERWRTWLIALRHGGALGRVTVRGEVEAVHRVTAAAVAGLSDDLERASAPLIVHAPSRAADRSLLWESIDAVDIYPIAPPEGQDAPARLERLPHLLSHDEAAALLPLPVADAFGAPGLPTTRGLDAQRVDQRPVHDGNRPSILLGQYHDRRESGAACTLELDQLVRHTLAVGAPGSGKSTTVSAIISRAWHEHEVPFLVIEPSKGEYARLLAGIDGLRVHTVGGDRTTLRLNLLAALPGESRHARHGRILSTLTMALPLAHPLPELLSVAIDRMLDRPDADRATLGMLRHEFAAHFAKRGLRGDALNIGVAFETRLQTLTSGALGSVLDTLESTPVAELVDRPTVIVFEQVARADDVRLLAAVILSIVRSAAQQRGVIGGLHHLTVIEEAHRVLSSVEGGGREDGDSLRAESTAAFAQGIAELRAYGEGFIIATQSPRTLLREVITSTSTQVAHRLVDEQDALAVAPPGSDRERVLEAIVRLRPGEAMVTSTAQAQTLGVQITPASLAPAAETVAPESADRLRPYALCGPEACPNGCSPTVRAASAPLANQLGDLLSTSLHERPRRIPLTDAARAVSEVDRDSDPRTRYCTVARLHAQTAIGAETSDNRSRQHLWHTIRAEGDTHA